MQLLHSFLLALAVLKLAVTGSANKIYGVNLGSWLVLEPWMLPAEWEAMGGEQCDDCSTCIASEFKFAKAYPDTVDEKFAEHWSTWFTQDHVRQLAAAGINTVRVPLGYWIVEALVDRPTETYPRGGIKFLSNGVKMLRDAGIQVILDHHALPGVQTAGQMFTGNCTSNVQFYTPYNYGRALTWTAVMTALAHLHPNFESVFAIEAVNEPIMDAAMTPNYGDFQVNFVKTVRAVELLLGIPVPGRTLDLPSNVSNLTSALASASSSDQTGLFSVEVVQAIKSALPMLVGLEEQLELSDILDLANARGRGGSRAALTTNFMDINWQHDNPSNPADAAIGPQGYDNHLYYSFGGVADANPTAYLTSICNLHRVQDDAALGNTPLWFGEWALPTQFTASDDFLFKWADAQKLAYSKGAGWLYWNFRVESSTQAGDLGRQWSYLEGLARGYLTEDPSRVNDPHVCDPYTNTTASVR
ncbi:glycoside hydrolase family 5 protein [Auriscalpium vulgare]|uniref:Glycoside hydrolase family 5 protein n=1 Tax=Auriscalpium vulgare TaxID=40419 RepID=A0ACB8RUD5_9AGAM|nr:glycoside hydrolase family 5 protein [Auriscalpium vulgare]